MDQHVAQRELARWFIGQENYVVSFDVDPALPQVVYSKWLVLSESSLFPVAVVCFYLSSEPVESGSVVIE
jgi:hypothetical protein